MMDAQSAPEWRVGGARRGPRYPGSVAESVFESLEPLLPRVKKPVQYVGGERNAGTKPWDAVPVHWALCYPDAYEVGLPNQGLMILYEVLNERDDALAERTYAVWPDLAALMREHGVPQFTVDGHRPVGAFDVLGISFATELGYTNMLSILDLAGIPLHAADRDTSHPIVLAGGHAAFNPEPIADFVDIVALGDGEEVVGEITDVVKAAKAEGLSRRETLERLAAVPGVYVPGLYEVRYGDDGTIAAVTPTSAHAPERVHKRTTSDLDDWPYPKAPLVPMAETVHERMSVEIFRGCTRGCRFCQAGMITRPVRERSPQGVGEMVEQGLQNSGYHEVGLLSLSSADHSGIGTHRQGPRRPLRGHRHGPLAPEHARRRVQRDARRGAHPQRPPVRPDVRARGRVRAPAQGDQQDGLRGGAHRHGLHRLRARLAAGEAVLHVRSAHRDRRGRAADRVDGPRGHPGRAQGRGPGRRPGDGVDRRVRAEAAHAVPVGRPDRARRRRQPAAQAARGDQQRPLAGPQHRAALPRRPAQPHRRPAQPG